ncbi:hypothetical protein [Spirillospora albida]|nr:hypothetical protein [Spirillospora albida]
MSVILGVHAAAAGVPLGATTYYLDELVEAALTHHAEALSA